MTYRKLFISVFLVLSVLIISPSILHADVTEDASFLPESKWVTTISDSKTSYHSIRLDKSGIIELHSNNHLTFALYNKNHKYIAGSAGTLQESNHYTAVLAVQSGTYYLQTIQKDSLPYRLRYSYRLSNPTLQNNRNFTIYPANTRQVLYYRYTPKKDGYLTLSALSNFNGKITLCNQKKQALIKSSPIYHASISHSKVVYGIQKGKTYYIRLTVNAKTIHSGFSKLRFSYTTIKNKSGNSKKKATKIRLQQKYSATLALRKNCEDWYQFYLSSPATLSLDLKASSNQGIAFQVYGPDGKKQFSSAKILNGTEKTCSLYSDEVLAPGTYYLKVSPAKQRSCGYYQFTFH